MGSGCRRDSPGDDVLHVLVPQGDPGLPSDGSSRDCALCRDREFSVPDLSTSCLVSCFLGDVLALSQSCCFSRASDVQPAPPPPSLPSLPDLLREQSPPPPMLGRKQLDAQGCEEGGAERGWAGHDDILKSASMKMGSAPVSLAMASRSR